MSIFASRTTKVIELPFDVPNTVTLQKLAGRHLQKAHDANLQESVDSLKRMGGPAFQRELAGMGDAAERAKQVAEHQADPMNGYDPYVLMQCGIKAWSYPEPVTPESIEDLDEEAVAFLSREILKLSKPGLFQTGEEAKAEQKND